MLSCNFIKLRLILIGFVICDLIAKIFDVFSKRDSNRTRFNFKKILKLMKREVDNICTFIIHHEKFLLTYIFICLTNFYSM